MGVTIGIDLGIGSVGWAVIRNDFKVLESCSNIFPAGDAESNVNRRSFRQGRRLKRRQRNRLMDFDKLWKNYDLTIPEHCTDDILNLRVKGLADNVSQDELYAVLRYMLSHRGISYLEDALDESSKGKSDYERGLLENQKELAKEKYPCQIQLERYLEFGKYRGMIETKDEEGNSITLLNVFTIDAYRKELEKLFEEQQKSHSFLSDEFVEEYMEIFNRKREYYVGPGNELSRTDYGRYTTKIDSDGNYITEENIFEKLIGKCSVYPEELRASGASYTAQEFNILNDLNNLIINGRKLEKEEKIAIIEAVQSANAVNMKKIIKTVIGEEIESMTGARIDKDNNEIFHSFETYNKMRRSMEKIGLDIHVFSVEELDKIADVLTINTERDAIKKALTDENKGVKNISDEYVNFFVDFRKKNGSLFSKYQSLSFKIMRELIPDLYERPVNQMVLLTEMGIFKGRDEKFKEYSKIPEELITDEIYNPVVRRSVSIAIKVINALMKKYEDIDQIVIEMPRDRNSEEEKKRIKDEQNKNEKELKGILDKIKSEYGMIITDSDFRNHKKLRMKLKLWSEQDGRCLYSGKSIDIDDLVHNPENYEIDHIIPRSISFDDSRANKVLVYRTENQNKGNQSPYQYLSKVKREWDFDEFMSYVLTLRGKKNPLTKDYYLSKKKVENLLFNQDITKIDVMKGFITRNINDTRYASREVLNSLQSYFRVHNSNTKVKVIRGSFTHQMRNSFRLEKNREESNGHHAVDAMLIAYSQMGYDAYREYMARYVDWEEDIILNQNGLLEAIDDKQMENIMYYDKHQKMEMALIEGSKHIKYWYKVDKKVNRALCNQTIRGTREYGGKTFKINKLNLFTRDGLKTFESLIKEDKNGKTNVERLLVYKNDPKTFEQIMKIYHDYEGETNPFVAYEAETGDYVRKYAKKHNGPRITTLKYIDGEVGSCIDISHKYGFEKGSKKVILESLKPYCTDVYYHAEEKKYYLVGLKYSDLKSSKQGYIVDEEKYKSILINEKMITDEQNVEDLKSLGFEFCFRLFKNDIIEYKKDGEVYRERFLSRTMPNKSGYIERKPIEKSKCEKQRVIGLSKAEYIKKINTDILGNSYYQH